MTAARTSGTGAPGYGETLPREPESAEKARLLVSAALSTWGLGELIDMAKLVVTELVANSVNHTRCHTLRVLVSRKGPDMVRIGVADRNRAVPVLGRPDADAEEGRGLLLVDAMSENWGYDRLHWGKVAWAELRATACAKGSA